MAVTDIKIIKGIMYGLIFGATSPIPGVSAGTMAILLNIYDKFFTLISVAVIKKNLIFSFSFLVGCALGLFMVSNVIAFLFYNHGKVISFCFIGLILGCIPMIFKKATVSKVKFPYIFIFFIALAFMVFLARSGGDMSTNQTLEQLGGVDTSLLIWIFGSSFVSSMAMIIPGVGGSLMMFVFGVYSVYIEAISTLEPILIITFGVSMALGILTGVFIIKKLLIHFPQQLYFAILGLIIGSLLIIFPGFSMGAEGLLSIALMIFFAVFAYWLSTKER